MIPNPLSLDAKSFQPVQWLKFIVFVPLIFAAGCTTSRTTTTDRTAVEQALLTRTAEDVIQQFAPLPASPDRSFTLNESGLDGPDTVHIAAALKARFLHDGLRLTTDTTANDATILPRVLMSGIDDDEYLLGIPSIPIPLPGYTTIHLPELALFKLATQRGRTELGYAAFETGNGKLISDQAPIFSVRKYRRWTILFFFMFRTGDLGEPF